MKRILDKLDENFYDFNQNKAFTLAEVLITLSIIGIVAAFTIPVLVNKIQNHEYVVALKKFYTTQQDGWSRLLADEGVSNLDDTSVFQSIPGYPVCSADSADSDNCRNFYNNLKKYLRFNIVAAPNKYQWHLLSGAVWYDYSGSRFMVFSDGSVLNAFFFKKATSVDNNSAEIIKQKGGHMFSEQIEDSYSFAVDVNGFKKPNTLGRDIFMFYLSGDGKLYPYWGKDASLYDSPNSPQPWQNDSTICGTPGSSILGENVWGAGCAARVMDEGWEMNY